MSNNSIIVFLLVNKSETDAKSSVVSISAESL